MTFRARGPLTHLASRRVPSQGQDVANSLLLASGKGFLELFHRHVGACKVHLRVQSHLLVRVNANVLRLRRCGAASAPCHINEERAQRPHALQTPEQVEDACTLCQPTRSSPRLSTAEGSPSGVLGTKYSKLIEVAQ